MAESKTSTDHHETRRWIGERGGRPAPGKGTGDGAHGILRIGYPVGSGAEAS